MTTTQIETTQRAAAMARKQSRNRDRLAGPVAMAFIYTFLAFLALLTAFPFYYMLVASTQRTAEILRIPPPLWFSSALGWNYSDLIAALRFSTVSPSPPSTQRWYSSSALWVAMASPNTASPAEKGCSPFCWQP